MTLDRRCFLSGLSTTFLPLLSGCDKVSSVTYRFRTTIEVKTPDGLFSGSTVRQLSYGKPNFPFVSGRFYPQNIKGESVIIDLPAGSLFSLLYYGHSNTESGDGELLSYVDNHPEIDYGDIAKERSNQIDKMDFLIRRRLRWELPRDQYPRIVRFRNLDDPKSAELVYPGNMQKILGDGSDIVKISLEIVDDNVTDNIRKYIPWIDRYLSISFAGNRHNASNDFLDTLSLSSFTTEARP